MQKNTAKMNPLANRLALVLLLSLAACANNQPMQEKENTAPPGQPEPEPPTALLEFTQSGGLLGVHDHLVIYDNGNARITRKNTSTNFGITPTDRAVLDELLKECRPDPPAPPADGFARGMADYITYTFKTADHDFSYTDVDMPQRVREVVQTINSRFIQRNKE